MPFLFGSGKQTRGLGHSCTLRFEFQKASLEDIKTLLEPLSLGFLIVPNRPGVHRINDGSHGHQGGNTTGHRQEIGGLCHRQHCGRGRPNTGQNRTKPENPKMASHGAMGKAVTREPCKHDHQAADLLHSAVIKPQSTQAEKNWPCNGGGRCDPRTCDGVIQGHVLNKDPPNQQQQRRSKTGQHDTVAVHQALDGRPCEPYSTHQEGKSRQQGRVFHPSKALSTLGFNGCIRIRPCDHANALPAVAHNHSDEMSPARWRVNRSSGNVHVWYRGVKRYEGTSCPDSSPWMTYPTKKS